MYTIQVSDAVLEVVFAWNPYNFAIFLQFYKYESHPFCFLSACVQSTPLCGEYLSTLCACSNLENAEQEPLKVGIKPLCHFYMPKQSILTLIGDPPSN